ncbi:MAG: hypothetical protein NTW82_10520 [Bacteroidia bacterium]|nr:hypothetical protein [Bacteroidia bacterium]
MKAINESPNLLKESMLQGMIANFKNEGSLIPMFFFLKENKVYLSPIPDEYLSSFEGKVRFSNFLKEICRKPCISAIGFLYEAYLACTQKGSQLGELLDSGNLRIADLKVKQDAIVMHFATPERQEAFIFPVDVKNKTVGERFDTSDGVAEGLFANLFKNAA